MQNTNTRKAGKLAPKANTAKPAATATAKGTDTPKAVTPAPVAKPQAVAAVAGYMGLLAALVADGWQVVNLASKAKAHKPGTNGVICLYPVAGGRVCKVYSAHVVGPKGMAGSGPSVPKHTLATCADVLAVANTLASKGYTDASAMFYAKAVGFADRLNRLSPSQHADYAAKGWLATVQA